MSGPIDGITPKLDKVPLDHFATELGKDIASHQIHDEGWELRVRQYTIPGISAGVSAVSFMPGVNRPMGPPLHTSIELHGPQRADGSHFYASIDTFTMNHDGEATFYGPGSEMRMTTDLEREGNFVTKDSNMVRDLQLGSGSGTDMLLKFSQIAEQVQEFNAAGPQYHPFSWDGYLNMRGEEWANSNSGPIQVLENLGFDVRNIDGADLRNPYVQKGFIPFYVPGADDDISSLFQKQEPGTFESFQGNSAALVENPDMLAKVNQLFTTLHPDYIAATDPEMGGATPGITNAPKPGG